MIAGKKTLFFHKFEAQMIRTVPRRVNRSDGPIRPRDNVPILKEYVGRELCIRSLSFEFFGQFVKFFSVLLLLFIRDICRKIDSILRVVFPHCSVRSKAIGKCACSFLQIFGQRGVVTMGMGNEGVRYCFTRLKSIQDVIKVAL